MKEHVNEFKECGVAVELTDLANSVASAVLGATISEETENDLEFSAEDNAPYGGLAFYINKMVDGVKSTMVSITRNSKRPCRGPRIPPKEIPSLWPEDR